MTSIVNIANFKQELSVRLDTVISERKLDTLSQLLSTAIDVVIETTKVDQKYTPVRDDIFRTIGANLGLHLFGLVIDGEASAAAQLISVVKQQTQDIQIGALRTSFIQSLPLALSRAACFPQGKAKKIYTTGEAAEVCQLSQQTVIRAFDAGRMGGFKVPGSKFRRIPHAELVKFMNLNDVKPDTDRDSMRAALEEAIKNTGEPEFTAVLEPRKPIPAINAKSLKAHLGWLLQPHRPF